jgi:hypothetical protein
MEIRAEMSRLRIGLMVNSFVQPAWVAALLDQLLAADFLELALVIRRTPESLPEPEPFLKNLLNRRRSLVYLAYQRLDRTLFPWTPDAFDPIDVGPRLSSVPCLIVAPVRKEIAERFPAEAIETIRGHDLDVVLSFDFGILRGDILSAARHGIWSFHHGDPSTRRGGPPGFWEIAEGRATTGAMLQVLTEDPDSGRVLYRARYRTDPISLNRTLNGLYWKSVPFAIRGLEHIARTGSPPSNDSRDYEPYCNRLYVVPSNWETCKHAARLATTYLRRKVDTAIHPPLQWQIAYSFTKEFPSAFYRFKTLTPPPDRFWADPFPLFHEGRHYILFEELLYKRKLGHLAIIAVNEDGTVGEAIKILEKPYHLSYPQVFRWRGELFFMPESARNRSLDVYRCRRFPDEWEHHATVMEDVRVVDATLHERDGRWWLFGGMATDFDTKNEALYLFSSITPFGPWKPHPANPVKLDACSARPAGWLFPYRGNLYRPAQDQSPGTGMQLVLNRVDTLTETEYRETEVSRIRGDWLPGQLGVHTINHADGLAVVDLYLRRPVL